MQLRKPTRAEIQSEVKDYIFITLGLVCYALGWVAFMLPYQITTGGTTGVGAIIYYATGFPMQWSYFIINGALMLMAIKVLGPRFSIRTTYAIFGLTFLLDLFQKLTIQPDGTFPQLLGPGQDSMACIIGSALCGAGLGIVFNANGSTGGTDIIAAVIHKYKDVTLGSMVMLSDALIISSCYFVFNDWRKVIFGFVAVAVISFVLDYVVNSARQSVQFFIFSKEYAKIADRITKETHRGVTMLDGVGWYSQNGVKVLVTIVYKRQSGDVFRLVKEIDPNAFISQSAVIGAYGEGFAQLKAPKAAKKEEKKQ